MNHSTPGLPVHHQLLELAQTPLSRWCHPAISFSVVPFSSRLKSFPASGSFPRSEFFTSGGQSIGVSTSASVLPVNIQDWFPLGWAGWNIPWNVPLVSLIFLKRSLVFPKYQSFNISPYNEYSGLISFTSDWLDLLAVQGTLKSLLQHHSSKAPILQRSALSLCNFYSSVIWIFHLTLVGLIEPFMFYSSASNLLMTSITAQDKIQTS